jgi:type IV pilus assembly protein PilB
MRPSYSAADSSPDSPGLATLPRDPAAGSGTNALDSIAELLQSRVVGAGDLADLDATVVLLIPEAVARQGCVLALARTETILEVAIADPLDVVTLDRVRAATHLRVVPALASRSDIEHAIERYYRGQEAAREVQEIVDTVDVLSEPGPVEETTDVTELRKQVEEAPVVRLVNLILVEAIQQRASDIHVEPERTRVLVRYRIDGVLHEAMRPPRELLMGIVSRIKVLSNMDIAVRLRPQDGGFSVSLGDRKVDLRVSTLPTVFGEKIVIRLFDKGAFDRRLANLGMDGEALRAFKVAIGKPHGMILMSGPTGSGKSTTLYSALNEIKSSEINVITVEDPVEYQVDGLNQVCAHPKAGLTFAAALKSILRQDPDVIMVGEIRDLETAEIAVKAALTGHLLFSSVHANDSVSTVTRLVDIGVERFLVASAVHLVVAQRLLRRVCTHCRESYRPDPGAVAALGPDAASLAGVDLVRGRGCVHCMKTGYLGRCGLFEVLSMSRRIRELIARGGHDDEIRRAALEDGLVPLRRAGIDKIRSGVTTIDEVLEATFQDDEG